MRRVELFCHFDVSGFTMKRIVNQVLKTRYFVFYRLEYFIERYISFLDVIALTDINNKLLDIKLSR